MAIIVVFNVKIQEGKIMFSVKTPENEVLKINDVFLARISIDLVDLYRKEHLKKILLKRGIAWTVSGNEIQFFFDANKGFSIKKTERMYNTYFELRKKVPFIKKHRFIGCIIDNGTTKVLKLL